jgi:tetratricopeptide (TPR) repeat protein
LGEHDKGLADRSKAIELDPQLPEAWFARGSAYYLLGDYAKAQSDIAQALRLRPEYKEAAEVFARAQKHLEESKQAEAKNTAPALAPQGAPPVSVPAPAPAPVAKASPAPIPTPTATPAPLPAGTEQQHEARGRAFIQAEKFPEALVELNQAIQLDPKATRALNARGYVYLRQRDYQHALADFDTAIRLDPQYANAYKNRAVTRKALGDAAGAAADLKAGR